MAIRFYIQKVIYSLLICASLLACESSDEKLTYLNYDLKLLEGDWRTKNLTDGIHSNQLVFTFEDTLCSFIYPEGQFGSYSISSNVLKISVFKEKKKRVFNFRIVELDSEEMVLIPTGSSSEQLLERFRISRSKEIIEQLGLKQPSKVDTLYFKKIKEKNSIDVSKISFRSSPCDFQCPVLYIEIEKSKNVIFYGDSETKLIGGYTGKISENQYSVLVSKIRNLDLEKIQPSYYGSKSGDQECRLIIEYDNGKLLSTRVYGIDQEPIELRILLHKLQELYKVVELKKSSDVNPDSFGSLGVPFTEPW